MAFLPSALISQNCRIIKYHDGFKLAAPEDVPGCLTVSDICDLPMPVYFMDAESHMVIVNEETAKCVGRQSIPDTLGKTAINFWCKEFGSLLLANDNAVIRSGKLKVIEESGPRNDHALVQVISFKLPWYQEDKIIGLLGLSIYTDADSFNDFAPSLSRILSTGLLNSNSFRITPNKCQYNKLKIYLSPRENELMIYLSRGKTAKDIGRILNISNRTVENCIARIKNKFNCHTKSELIDIYNSLD